MLCGAVSVAAAAAAAAVVKRGGGRVRRTNESQEFPQFKFKKRRCTSRREESKYN
jgi:hypothetical protein